VAITARVIKTLGPVRRRRASATSCTRKVRTTGSISTARSTRATRAGTRWSRCTPGPVSRPSHLDHGDGVLHPRDAVCGSRAGNASQDGTVTSSR